MRGIYGLEKLLKTEGYAECQPKSGVGLTQKALRLSCLGPAATQLQSRQAAGLKDRLVLQPVGDTLGHVCGKGVCKEAEIRREIGFSF